MQALNGTQKKREKKKKKNAYLSSHEVQASPVRADVDVLTARTLQAQLVYLAAGRTAVHLTNRRGEGQG